MAQEDDWELPEPDTVDLDDDQDDDTEVEEDKSDNDTDHVDTERIADTAARSAKAVGKIPITLAVMGGQTASRFVDLFPKSWILYHKLTQWSIYKMQRASGADSVANVNRGNGREDIRPAKMVDAGEDGKEMGGWKILGLDQKRYDSSVIGGHSNRLGKADIIHVNEDDLEQGTWAECAMDAAIATNREQYLFRDADLHAHIDVTGVDEDQRRMPERSAQIEPTADDAAANGETAADGGYRQELLSVSIERPGVLQDMLVPLQSERGYDGQLVSWTSYQNLKQEQGDQDQIRDAKNASWVAAKLDDVSERDLVKLALIATVILAMALFHADIGAAIASFGSGGGGGGGGGGGSAIPVLGSALVPISRGE